METYRDMKFTARFPLRTIACLILAGQALMAHDPHDPIQAIAVSPNFANDQTIFAASGLLSLKFGIFVVLKSTDGGVIWSVVQNMSNNAAIYQIVFSPNYANDQTLYVVGAGGLFQSTNQGTSWTQLTRTALLSVALSPNYAIDNTMFAVTTERVALISKNRGSTLKPVSAPPSLTAGLTTVAISPNYDVDSTVLLGSMANGIFLSTNSGASWTPVTTGLLISQVTSLAFSPNWVNDQTAFAGTYGTGVLISTNKGKTWNPSSLGITDLYVLSLAVSPNYLTDSTIWETSATAGVFQSNTSGSVWMPGTTISRTLSTLTCNHYQQIVPATGGRNPQLYLATYEGLWSSNNGAQSWLYIDTLPTRLIRRINLSPNYAMDQTLFANTYGGGNLWSTDGGLNWTNPNTGMLLAYTDASAISPNFAVDGIAYSSDAKGLHMTSNLEDSYCPTQSEQVICWQLMQPGLGAGVATYPRALAISPGFAEDSTVLIGLSVDSQTTGCMPPPSPPFPEDYNGTSSTTGVYVSTNQGVNWQSTSLTGVAGVVSIALSPGYSTDRTAFAASPNNGVYKSIDGGFTWTLLTLPGTTQAAAQVVVTPTFSTDQTVYAAGVSGGLFKSTNGGTTWTEIAGTPPIRILDMQVSPNYARDKSLYAGTVQKGLLKFINGNKTVVLGLPDTLVTAVGLSPNLANDHTLYAAGYHGLFMSTNYGSSWTFTGEPARMEESRQANSLYAPQNPPSIIYQGLWSAMYPATASSTNAFVSTSEPNDTATLNFTGDGVRWVGWIGPDQGMASITLDGVPQTTVNLFAPMDMYQQTIWQMQGLTCGLHTLTVTALPSQPGNTVSVDAFDVWIATCPTH